MFFLFDEINFDGRIDGSIGKVPVLVTIKLDPMSRSDYGRSPFVDRSRSRGKGDSKRLAIYYRRS